MTTRNTTHQLLPAINDDVQFTVRYHQTWLSGTFDGDCFRSRWAAYETWEVSAWRKPDTLAHLHAKSREHAG